jgi:transcriptional regulator with XRE-family HTH domain
MSELGETLRAAREAGSMTQEALAGCFGISKSAVQMWEAGRNIPDQGKIATLADTLKLDPGLLVRPAGIPAAGASSPPRRPRIPVWPSAEAGNDGAMKRGLAAAPRKARRRP